MKREKIVELFRRLRELDPHPTTELDYTTPFELLVSVILSAPDGETMPGAAAQVKECAIRGIG